MWLGPHRRLAAACTWSGLGPHDWSLGLAGRLWSSSTRGLRWLVETMVWSGRHLGDWGWLGGDCSPQHFLAVGFSIPGCSCLVGFSFLLPPGELVSDGLDGSYLGIYQLRSTRWLHTRVPGGGTGGAVW